MKLKKSSIFLILLFVLIIILGLLSIPEMTHINKRVSESTGSVRKGKLINGWLLPYRSVNFHYFSPFSYYILNNAYVHSSIHRTLTDAYKTCNSTCPGKEFIYMECSGKNGGRMIFHWTHQNGMSVDFMTPIKRNSKYDAWPNHSGLFHYLFEFDEDGKFTLGPKTEIDFETMASHIMALDEAAEKHGLRIRKILFHTDLHDNLFSTPAGKQLIKRNVNFIPHLSDLINNLHDDHYHVDFEVAP